MQIDKNNIQSLSETESLLELTSLNSFLETSCEIQLSEHFYYGNPATWSLINDKFRLFIIKHGPKLETYKNYNFSLYETNRYFHEKWLFRTT